MRRPRRIPRLLLPEEARVDVVGLRGALSLRSERHGIASHRTAGGASDEQCTSFVVVNLCFSAFRPSRTRSNKLYLKQYLSMNIHALRHAIPMCVVRRLRPPPATPAGAGRTASRSRRVAAFAVAEARPVQHVNKINK